MMGSGLFVSVEPGALERQARPEERGPWRRLLDLLFPPRCGACRGRGAWLCPACEAKIERLGASGCRRCGGPVEAGAICPTCRRDPPRLVRILAAARHDGVARDLVHALKYGGVRPLAPILAVLLDGTLREAPELSGVLVPVPLHPVRERRRGFNQSLLIARALAARRTPPLPLAERALHRTRPTPPQTHLDRARRRANVAGAFRCADRSLAGETVILIDDVATTGATLEACALALRQADVTRVYGLVVARA